MGTGGTEANKTPVWHILIAMVVGLAREVDELKQELRPSKTPAIQRDGKAATIQ